MRDAYRHEFSWKSILARHVVLIDEYKIPSLFENVIIPHQRWHWECCKVNSLKSLLTDADNKLEHVPGTVLLNEKGADSITGTVGLKHGDGHDAHILLAPQPSEDPNDPLNWSKLRKDLNLIVLSFGAILHVAVSV